VKTKSQIEKFKLRLKEAATEERRLTRLVSRTEAEVDRFKMELTDLDTLVGKTCPKCKQVVDEEHACELRAETGAELAEAKSQLAVSKKEYKQAKEDLESLKKKERELEKTLGLIEKLSIYLTRDTEYKGDIRGTKTKLEKVQSKLMDEKAKLREHDVSGLKDKEEELDSWCASLRDLKGKVVGLPKDITKRQKKDEDLGTIQRELEKLQAMSLDRTIPALKKQIDSMDDRKERLTSLKELTGKLVSLEEQMSVWETDLKQINRKLNQAKKQFNQKVFNDLTTGYNDLKDLVVKLDTETHNLKEETIPTAQDAFDESKEAADAIEKKREEHERIRRSLEVLGTIREFYREVQIPLRVRDVRRASSHATEAFKSLMGTNEFDRVMITDNHELQVSRFGELEPMRALSGGEQVLAALAVRLGFAHALVGSDLLILDEPTAYLDDTRKAELVQTLTHASPAKQMLIVTHDDDFKSVAQKIIRVQKDDSTLVSNVSIRE
jgi:exonuclease SbcC